MVWTACYYSPNLVQVGVGQQVGSWAWRAASCQAVLAQQRCLASIAKPVHPPQEEIMVSSLCSKHDVLA